MPYQQPGTMEAHASLKHRRIGSSKNERKRWHILKAQEMEEAFAAGNCRAQFQPIRSTSQKKTSETICEKDGTVIHAQNRRERWAELLKEPFSWSSPTQPMEEPSGTEWNINTNPPPITEIQPTRHLVRIACTPHSSECGGPGEQSDDRISDLERQQNTSRMEALDRHTSLQRHQCIRLVFIASMVPSGVMLRRLAALLQIRGVKVASSEKLESPQCRKTMVIHCLWKRGVSLISGESTTFEPSGRVSFYSKFDDQLAGERCDTESTVVANGRTVPYSMTALYSVHNVSSRFCTFVVNRLTIVRDAPSPTPWRHVTAENNPTDVVSRGTYNLIQLRGWLTGSRCLLEQESNWPPQARLKPPELKSLVVRVRKLERNDGVCLIIDRFSCWVKLQKAVAWSLRYNQYLLIKAGRRHLKCVLDPFSRHPEESMERPDHTTVRWFASEKMSYTKHSTCNTQVMSPDWVCTRTVRIGHIEAVGWHFRILIGLKQKSSMPSYWIWKCFEEYITNDYVIFLRANSKCNYHSRFVYGKNSCCCIGRPASCRRIGWFGESPFGTFVYGELMSIELTLVGVRLSEGRVVITWIPLNLTHLLFRQLNRRNTHKTTKTKENPPVAPEVNHPEVKA
ncbi:hypothetical protein CLF_103758 [Clonorchis sinensis]|uniref:Uncharacterized protein n=1 Tax=Clonorchis sinensis TaxID=79923 RepID=G7YAB6_CLOSI|nr:hypothetical protein CLF_103758 [Clonorchis sinensis]